MSLRVYVRQVCSRSVVAAWLLGDGRYQRTEPLKSQEGKCSDLIKQISAKESTRLTSGKLKVQTQFGVCP